MFEKVKNVVIKAGNENSITIEFNSFEDLLEALKAVIEGLEKVMKIKEEIEKDDTEKIAESIAKMIKETMEKAPNQIVHFGEITKDGKVREITAEEFAEKYLKGRERKRKRKRGEDNEQDNNL